MAENKKKLCRCGHVVGIHPWSGKLRVAPCNHPNCDCKDFAPVEPQTKVNRFK